MRARRLLSGMLPLLAMILLASCASGSKTVDAVQPSFAEIPEDSAAGIDLQFKKEGADRESFTLRYPDWGDVEIRGSASPEDSGWKLSFEGLDWFDNWANGWTEASFLLEGEAKLAPSGTSGVWILSLKTKPQLDAVSFAAIRYFDTYLRGDRAVEEFSRRWDRIRAVCQDLSEHFDGPSLARRPEALRGYLFPELYGYDQAPKPGFAVAFGQGQEWNADYTKAHFSEGLGQLRDSGAMLRDYKESPGLWQLALSWDDFWDHRGYAAGLKQRN